STILSGNDDQAMPLMMSGGSGVISVLSNLLPGVMKEICDHILGEDYPAARELYYKYHRLMKLIFIDVNPIPIKFAMAQIGLANNNLRRPLIKLSSKNQEILLEEMRRLEII
ncbi:MAG: 4-hydroxy-tetrahydrodipicolinate synthase, partial [Halanaerobium sp. MSAO_Bac5]